jgi:transcriptional regulator with XRE-family HTH domain
MVAGFTQRDLAERVRTSQGTIYELERLTRGAYPKTIKKLCAALEVEPSDLLCAEIAEQEER